MTIIAAMDKNRLIGVDNSLPWRLSADLQNFKKLTSGNAIIMGRKTWDSLGRPLPNRKNIVITRNKEFIAEGATIVHSIEDAIKTAGELDAFVIGGGEIYSMSLEQATKMVLTHVETEAKGDAWFPAFDQGLWEISGSDNFNADEKNEFDFSVTTYIKK